MRTLILGVLLRSSVAAPVAWVTPSNAGGKLVCGPKGSRYFPSVKRKAHVHRTHERSMSGIPTTLLMPGPHFYPPLRSRKLIRWVMAQSWFLTPLPHHICIKSSSCKLWLITASVCRAWMKLAGLQWALGFWPARLKEVIPGVRINIAPNGVWLNKSFPVAWFRV